MTLAEALERAERDNPDLAALRALGDEARDLADAAGRATRPRLSISVDAFRTDDPVRVFGATLGAGTLSAEDLAIERLNDPSALSHLASSVRIEAPLDVFGAAKAAARSAAAGARARRASVDEARQDLRQRVVEAYHQAALAAAAVRVTGHALDAARAREADLQARVDA